MQGVVTCEAVRARNRLIMHDERERQIQFWLERGIARAAGVLPTEFVDSVPPLDGGRVEAGCDLSVLPALLVVPMPFVRFCEWRGIRSASRQFAIGDIREPNGADGDPYWIYFVTATMRRSGEQLLSALELAFFAGIVSCMPPHHRVLSGTSWGRGKLVALAPAGRRDVAPHLIPGELSRARGGDWSEEWFIGVHDSHG